MIEKLKIKNYIFISIVIIFINTQGLFYINNYLPGTILLSMAMVVYFLQYPVKLKAKLWWVFIPTIVYWISEKLLYFTGLGGSFITFRFVPLLIVVALGHFTKNIVVRKNWKTVVLLLAVWFIDIVWTAVTYKQGMNAATRIYQGGSPEDELNFINRFFLGIVYSIEICSFLSVVEFKTAQVGEPIS